MTNEGNVSARPLNLAFTDWQDKIVLLRFFRHWKRDTIISVLKYYRNAVRGLSEQREDSLLHKRESLRRVSLPLQVDTRRC